MQVSGLAPFVPPDRPRAAAIWWSARGEVREGRLVVDRLEERTDPGPIESACGIAAPLTLPGEFVAWAGDVSTWTRDRLFAAARSFAFRRPRGKKHPLREGESRSVLDRRRLALYHAARELPRGKLIEVDLPALLRTHGLPATHLAGSSARAIARRAAVLRELDITVAERDYAIGCWPALAAVLCCFATR